MGADDREECHSGVLVHSGGGGAYAEPCCPESFAKHRERILSFLRVSQSILSFHHKETINVGSKKTCSSRLKRYTVDARIKILPSVPSICAIFLFG